MLCVISEVLTLVLLSRKNSTTKFYKRKTYLWTQIWHSADRENVDFLTAKKSLVPCGDKPSLGFVGAHPELPLKYNAVADV